MSLVRPFRGLRPRPELAGKIAAPPYDVLSSDEARERVKNNPISFLRVNKPEVDFPSGSLPYGKEAYERGRENFESLISGGHMIQDKKPCFYLYELTWKGKSEIGLVALCSLDEYQAGRIKKHERTRPDKVNDRANHMMTVKAQVGPVMLAFRTKHEIVEFFEEFSSDSPDTAFTSEEVEHKVWVIDDESSINRLKAAFANVDYLYIADGHHRSESAAEVRRRMKESIPHHTGQESYNFFLGVIFPSDQMRILPYNRIVSNFNGIKIDNLFERARKNFEFNEAKVQVKPNTNDTFGLYTAGQWYQLKAKPGTFDASSLTASISSDILEKTFLNPVLGITDVRKDGRVDFVGGIRGLAELERLVDSGEYKMALSVSPVTVEQLLKVADAGEIMPTKSTWFEPKLKSGLIVHLFE